MPEGRAERRAVSRKSKQPVRLMPSANVGQNFASAFHTDYVWFAPQTEVVRGPGER
jgi:hypothetical protein